MEESGIESLTFPPIENAWFLTGPTAAGKSFVAQDLATRLDLELISLDSMSIYRGMDLGTAKPSKSDREKVPHHLIDIVNPNEEFSLAEYLSAAHGVARRLRGEGKPILFVGGTPLYLKSLLRGLYQGPPPDWEFRRQVEEEIAATGIEALRERLALVDPLSAHKLHPHDKRRMIRALEVHRATGRPISHSQVQFEDGQTNLSCKVFVLRWPRASLHDRIGARVESMFKAGLVDEVRGLLDRYGDLSRTASQAVGYREVIEHLEGKSTESTTIESVKARTRQFARRQETWFRALEESQFVEIDSPSNLRELSNRLADELKLMEGARGEHKSIS